MKAPDYDEVTQFLKQAVEDDASRLTGAVRLCWEDLEPLLESGYINAEQLAKKTGANATSLRSSILRVRQEYARQEHERRYGRADDKPARYAPHHSTERASSTSEGKPKRVGNLIIKDQPKHQPAEVPDEDGFITLDNGVRYRRHPRNPKFFEVHPPGDSKPFTTHRKPLPTDRVDP